MINNIQNLFSKYKLNLNSKKEIESETILFIKENTKIELSTKNLKVNLKDKKVKLVNLNSSLRFVLNNNIDNQLLEKFKKETGFSLFLV